MVEGLGWVVDPNIMDLIPTRSNPGLPDMQFWQVGPCIRGLLLRGESKGSYLMRFHVIKEGVSVLT